MTRTFLSSATPALLAALFVAATWLPTVGAPANPFAEQAARA